MPARPSLPTLRSRLRALLPTVGISAAAQTAGSIIGAFIALPFAVVVGHKIGINPDAMPTIPMILDDPLRVETYLPLGDPGLRAVFVITIVGAITGGLVVGAWLTSRPLRRSARVDVSFLSCVIAFTLGFTVEIPLWLWAHDLPGFDLVGLALSSTVTALVLRALTRRARTRQAAR